LHPAAGDARPQLADWASRLQDRAAVVHTTNHIYAGASRNDDARPYLQTERALFLAYKGDSSAARTLRPGGVNWPTNTSSVELKLAIASDSISRHTAIREALALDSLYGNAYAPQHPLSPRVLLHLPLARVLAAEGRNGEALAHLATIPEDFGFNIGFLAEVHRQRSALLTRLGNAAGAESERRAVTRIVRPATVSSTRTSAQAH
jgi:hypothetical protein